MIAITPSVNASSLPFGIFQLLGFFMRENSQDNSIPSIGMVLHFWCNRRRKCQYPHVNAPPIFTHTAPAIFTNDVPLSRWVWKQTEVFCKSKQMRLAKTTAQRCHWLRNPLHNNVQVLKSSKSVSLASCAFRRTRAEIHNDGLASAFNKLTFITAGNLTRCCAPKKQTY